MFINRFSIRLILAMILLGQEINYPVSFVVFFFKDTAKSGDLGLRTGNCRVILV